MSVSDDKESQKEKKKRRFLSPEKKFQIYLESQSGKAQVGEILRREGIYSTDLARVRKLAITKESVEKGPPTKFPDPSLIIEKEYAASKHI